MKNHGWFLVWRKMEDWEWYKTPHMRHLFEHLILKANHKENSWQGINIKRGQLLTSLKSLSQQTGISIKSVRTCLRRLKNTGEIIEKSTNRFRLITICNYDIYQAEGQATGKQRASNGQQTTMYKQCNNLKKKDLFKNKDMFEVSYKKQFEEARKIYKGTKRGLDTEFNNFTKKHKNWRNIIPLLKPAILKQIEWRKQDKRYWKNFQTWINNSCWEEEVVDKKETIDEQFERLKKDGRFDE